MRCKEVIIKKSLVIASVVAGMGIASVAGVGLVSAQNSAPGSNNLVDKIAQKFNLNKADVQKVFDENHTAKQAERQQKMNERLDQAVKEGKITQAQEDLIKAKLKELQAARDALLKDKTPAERKAALKTEQDQLKQWATDNKIPLKFLMHGAGQGKGGLSRDGNGIQ